MGLDKQWRKLAMIFIALALLMPIAAAFAGTGTDTSVNRTHEGIQGGTGTGYYTITYTTTAQQPGSYPAENAETGNTNIGWYDITRGNEPPNITQIYILSSSSLNLSTGDITCFVNATDSDNTTLTITYNWYNQSVQIPSLSGQATATSGILINISTLSSYNLSAGQNWTCEAKAWDGYYNETKWNNASIIIRGITPPGGSKGPGLGTGGGGVERKPTKECSEAWACTEWSACNITRTRNCTDINKCGKEQYKPATTEVCELKAKITETLRKEQKQELPIKTKQYTPSLTEIPIKRPTILEQAWASTAITRQKIAILAKQAITTTASAITYAANALENAITKTTENHTQAAEKTLDIAKKTLATLEAIITKASQEQAGILTKILHAITEIIQKAISITKAAINGAIEAIKGAIKLSIEAAATAIESAKEAVTKTTETTKQRTTTATETAETLRGLLTPDNIEFILATIIYLTLIAATITALRYFTRQYKTQERSRRLRTETRALLATGIILQALHFVIFQRELYPAYISTLAIITVFIADWLIWAIPPKLRRQERIEHEKLEKLLEANKEELEEAEKLARKQILPPRAPTEESALSREEKYRLTRTKTEIEHIKEETRPAEAEKKPLKEMLKDLAEFMPGRTITRTEERELSKARELGRKLEKYLSKQGKPTEETALSRTEETKYEQLKRRAKEITTRRTTETTTIEDLKKRLKLEPTPIEKLRQKIQEIKARLEERRAKQAAEEKQKQEKNAAQLHQQEAAEIRKTIEFEKKLDLYTPQKTKEPTHKEQEAYIRRKERIQEILTKHPAEKEYEAITKEITEIEALKQPTTERIKNAITQYLERRRQLRAQEAKKKELIRIKQQKEEERQQKQLEQERKEEKRRAEAILKQQQEEKERQQKQLEILKKKEEQRIEALQRKEERQKQAERRITERFEKQLDRYINKQQKTRLPEQKEKTQKLKEQIQALEGHKKLHSLENETETIGTLLKQAEQTAKEAEQQARIPATERKKTKQPEKTHGFLKRILAGKKEQQKPPVLDTKTRQKLREEIQKTKGFEKELDKNLKKTKEPAAGKEQPAKEKTARRINEIQDITRKEHEISQREKATAQQIQNAIKEYSREERKKEFRGFRQKLAAIFRKKQQATPEPKPEQLPAKTYQKIQKEISKTIKLENELDRKTTIPRQARENKKAKKRTTLERLKEEIHGLHH